MRKYIETSSLIDFVQQIEQYIKTGWEVDFDSNDSVPTGSLGYYRCGVVKSGQIAALLVPSKNLTHLDNGKQDNVGTLNNSSDKDFIPSVFFSSKTEINPQKTSLVKKPGRTAKVSI